MVQEKKQKSGVLDFNKIKKLIEILEKSSLEEIEVDCKDVHLKLKKPSSAGSTVSQPAPAISVPALPIVQSLPSNVALEPSLEKKVTESKNTEIEANRFEVKSPMVGTFYRAPAPNANPFVKLGDFVKKGQTLCIIEAMKIMNEIESEVDGKVVEIRIENANPVEYGEVIMVIETA